MKLAIMQPYIFPYIGYFQLINAVDKFVIYDDVNYIKQGWINRNNILIQGKANTFTIPLDNTSSFKKIYEVSIHEKQFSLWKKKFIKTVEQSYSKAPRFDQTLQLITKVLDIDTPHTISRLATFGLVSISNYLGIKTKFVNSSSIYNNSNLSGKDRVIDICKTEKVSTYINSIGGQKLYNKDYFKINNIDLKFIKPKPIVYKQFSDNYVPWLSILDIMMFNTVDEITKMLDNYEVK